ncbi:hypothetical protein AB4Y96_03515 [Phyllobacterium sp. TAF24]|uniref:hypothetical protein n=1 Tax=unclassified Phyllobacterium TaxID=2638441 RepID=UPI00088713C1|nr:hypothetical protein [Phyllobacterium sp. OV277]SDP51430.1 hypothetical protein SAMN05443582_105231 [Phyllobacterium sp. OV277]
MPAYQVKFAYLTKYKQTRHLFHQLVIADDEATALAEGRRLMNKRSPNARIMHESCVVRPDSQEVESATAKGWVLNDNWWSRPIMPDDDLAAIAKHGFTHSNHIHAKSAMDCVAIDKYAA